VIFIITIKQETEGRSLVVKATENLTSQDYEKVFIPQLNQLIDKFGKIRVVFYLAENFTGWELGAAWDDAVFGIQHRHDFEKVAVVSDKNGWNGLQKSAPILWMVKSLPIDRQSLRMLWLG
jgi:hypothetical protein